MAKIIPALAAEVKAFAVENGLPVGGSRGRIPFAAIEAFEAATGQTYVRPNGTENQITVQVATSKGGKRPHKVSFPSSDARTGAAVGKRGRLPLSVLVAHAEGLAKAQGLTVV